MARDGRDPTLSLGQLNIGFLERPGQAAQQLLGGDLDAAARSMFQPETLTPAERDIFLKKHHLDKSPFSHLFRLLTNPVLIISLALSFKFPVPAAGNLFKVAKGLNGLTKRFPILGRLASSHALFQGTEFKSGKQLIRGVPDLLSQVVRDVTDFQSEWHGKMGNALKAYTSRSGGRLPDLKQQVMVASYLDGLHEFTRGYGGGKLGIVTLGTSWTKKTLKGAGALMPDLPEKMGGPLKQLADDYRVILDDLYVSVYGNLENRKAIARTLKRAREAGHLDVGDDVLREFIKNPKPIKHYFPHRVLLEEQDFGELVRRITQDTGPKGYATKAQKKVATWLGPEFMKREYSMLPSAEDLALVEDLVDPVAKARMMTIAKARVLDQARSDGVSRYGIERLEKLSYREIKENYVKHVGRGDAQKLGGLFADPNSSPVSYSLRMMPVMSSYIHTSAMTYGWSVKGSGEEMLMQLQRLKAAGSQAGGAYARQRATMLEDTYIPIAMGRGTFKSSLKAQAWEQSMLELATTMDKPIVKKLLGETLHKTLLTSLAESKGAFSLINLQRRVASYFYLSTLGINPASALKNSLQLVLTTGPVVGYRTAAMGLGQAFRKSHKYFAGRFGARKLTHDAALRAAYPEFGAAGLVASPITDETVQLSLQHAHDVISHPAVGKLATVKEKVSRAMMAMFTASENTVRLATFEAGMIHAARSNMPREAAIEFARKLTEQTQFLTGPANTPFAFLGLGPVLRQLTQFPMRMLEFATSTALRMGAADKTIFGNVNPGTMARMVAGSIIGIEIGDAFGLDMGDALLGGALPTFTKAGKILSPIPIVPPFVQLAGAFAMGVGSGDFEELRRSLPLVVPGGTALARAGGLVPPGIPGAGMAQSFSRVIGRTYADYGAPAPEGRIAVYTAQGVLRGYFSPWQIFLSGIGVKHGDFRAEQEVLQNLVRQRDQIRGARKEYLDARLKNDPGKAQGIVREFRQRFGFDLPVSPKDIQTVQLKRQISRIEQVLQTLPPGPARDEMVQMVATLMGERGEQVLGVDPALLGSSSAARNQSRGRNIPGAYLGRMGPLDSVRPGSLGRAPLPSPSKFGF